MNVIENVVDKIVCTLAHSKCSSNRKRGKKNYVFFVCVTARIDIVGFMCDFFFFIYFLSFSNFGNCYARYFIDGVLCGARKEIERGQDRTNDMVQQGRAKQQPSLNRIRANRTISLK